VREGAELVRRHTIRTSDHAFDDFAGSSEESGFNRKRLGL